MVPKKFFLFQNPLLLVGLGLALLAGTTILAFLYPSVKKTELGDQLESGKTSPPQTKWSKTISLWISVQSKIEDLQHAEEERQKLKLDNANLKVSLENAQMKCRSEETAQFTEKTELKLSTETGSRVGRTLASIDYRPPSGLLPSQLYTLAISYLNSHDDEKAAIILTFLTGLNNSDSFKTTKNYLITGMAWYRLENFVIAEQYFDDVLKSTNDQSNTPYQAQARLWKALISKRQDKEVKAQYWLRDLLEHHPHSREVKWVNPINQKEDFNG